MRLKPSLMAAAVWMTAGCASFDAMPRPIFEADSAVSHATSTYRFDNVVATIAPLDLPARTVYRNRVAAAYMMAIDARYFEFRRGLSRNVKGGNVGFDLALLALTGGAAVWESAAADLAAAATGVAGARGTLNRELYFERALPALVSLMEAQRLQIRTSILRGLRQDESQYTVEELFADLARYEGSASIDAAIQRASEIAGQQAAEARLDFSRTIELCEAPDDVARARFDYVRELSTAAMSQTATVAARERFARAAVVAGAAGAQASDAADVREQQLQTIADYVLGICSAEGLDRFKAQVDPPAPAALPARPGQQGGNGE